MLVFIVAEPGQHIATRLVVNCELGAVEVRRLLKEHDYVFLTVECDTAPPRGPEELDRVRALLDKLMGGDNDS